ncbi:MAG: Asp23/Gls24 family envelope stress response protein [Clostridia bacterium]|nr:Asp23/Gls24 family envelope stress response protein [Clostridia bacterium]
MPINVDVNLQNGGSITYANEVIAIIAGVACNEVEGIAGMVVGNGFGEIIGRNRNITRGVKVELGSEEASVDLYIIVEYGQPIQKVALEAQENVRKAIESMTGLHVVRVDVHVQGVSFEKEKKEMQSSLEAAKAPVLSAPQAVKEEAPAEEVKETAETVETAEEAEEKVQADFDEEVLAEEAQLEEVPAEEEKEN